MLTEVSKNIKLMFTSFKYNLSREMTNRAGFIMQVVFMMINNATFLVQWLILFSIKDNIGGYNMEMVLILWGLTSATFGFSHIFFQNVYSIHELIINGKLDVYLTQPKNVLFNVAISATNPSAIGDLLYGYVLILIVDPKLIFLFTIFVITGGIILTAFHAILGSLTFWIKRGDALVNSLFHLTVSTATYPEGIYKGVVKTMLYTLVPVGFMVFLPVQILNNFNLIHFGAVLLVTIILTVLAFIIFNAGLKKYSSSSLMSARI